MNNKNAFKIALLSVLLAFTVASPALAQFPSTPMTIGTINPGDSIVVCFEVTVNSGLAPSVMEVCNQGTVSGTNFSDLNTDDPDDATSSADPTCTEVKQGDVGVTAILSPVDGCGLGNAETVQIQIMNFSTVPASNFDVTFEVTGPVGTGPVTESFAGTIAAMSSATHSFSTSANLSTSGSYTVTASTDLTGDSNSSNDSFSENVDNFDEPTVTAGSTATGDGMCVGETVGLTANVSGGQGPFTFDWTPTTGLDDPSAQNPNASPAATTSYTVEVTDANGCTDTDQVTVTVFDFVFLADGDFVLNKTKHETPEGSVFSNGDITVEKGDPSEYDVNFTAVGEIEVEKENTINGDLEASSLDISGDATINGSQTTISVSAITLGSKSFSAGGANHTVPEEGSLSLAPGTYGVLTLEDKATIQLSSGEYFFEEIRYEEEEAVFDLDVSGGPIAINVTDNLELGPEVEIRLPDDEDDSDQVLFCTLQSDELELGKEAYFLGTLLAPNADVVLKKNTQLRGAICAKSIEIERDCLFIGHNSPGALLGPGNAKIPVSVEAIAELSSATPTEYALHQNYPNPFNPSTQIRFALPQSGEVSLRIFNSAGQLVRTLVSGEYSPGLYNVTWDARDDGERPVASGLYLYRLTVNDFVQQKKLMLMK